MTEQDTKLKIVLGLGAMCVIERGICQAIAPGEDMISMKREVLVRAVRVLLDEFDLRNLAQKVDYAERSCRFSRSMIGRLSSY